MDRKQVAIAFLVVAVTIAGFVGGFFVGRGVGRAELAAVLFSAPTPAQVVPVEVSQQRLADSLSMSICTMNNSKASCQKQLEAYRARQAKGKASIPSPNPSGAAQERAATQ